MARNAVPRSARSRPSSTTSARSQQWNYLLQRRSQGTCSLAYDDDDLCYFVKARQDRHFWNPDMRLVTRIWLDGFQGRGKTLLGGYGSRRAQYQMCLLPASSLLRVLKSSHDAATCKAENVLQTVLSQLA
ncbi:hypothetical protein J3458_000635 [Metarhizium acridum]|uniref:uncharacterized protein n=1 Tax=Metarhizium acridum TaxID=92637 RepID=UPI001C6B0C62|nr:hypothetical protein J3458_000635 [Metarhizium acridum]